MAQEFLTSTDAQKLLSGVKSSSVFKLHMGSDITSLRDLAEALDVMDDTSFKHHVTKEKNDFSKWVRDAIGDEELADYLEKTKDRRKMLQAVKRRIEFLENIKTESRMSTFFVRYGVVDFLIGLLIGIVAGYMIARFVIP